jgi:hypothetical protein
MFAEWVNLSLPAGIDDNRKSVPHPPCEIALGLRPRAREGASLVLNRRACVPASWQADQFPGQAANSTLPFMFCRRLKVNGNANRLVWNLECS